MKTSDHIKNEFRSYLIAKGYQPVSIGFNQFGVFARVKTHDVCIKDFTQIKKEGENTVVRLSPKDFENTNITGNLFRVKISELDQSNWSLKYKN